VARRKASARAADSANAGRAFEHPGQGLESQAITQPLATARATPSYEQPGCIETLIRQVYERCHGNLREGQYSISKIVEAAWPQTIEQTAQEFWGQHLHCLLFGHMRGDLDRALLTIKKLPDDLRAMVLALIDKQIEVSSKGTPLVDNHKRTYKFHPAAALALALSHSMFRHVSAERAGALLALPPEHDARYCIREAPRENFRDVADQLACEFGLWCCECERVFRYDPIDHRLGVSEYGFCLQLQEHDHFWNSGLCPACWERTRPAREQARLHRHAEEARRQCEAAARVDQASKLIPIQRPPARPAPRAAKPKPRSNQYSRKVMIWKAAYDALRELGIPIEEIANDVYGNEGR
jgi:hypothetical protein